MIAKRTRSTEPVARGVVELIVGVTSNPVFGEALTVGLGDVLTKLYGDVSHHLLSVDDTVVR
jgi:acyl-CoA synthetase (NDP forming)